MSLDLLFNKLDMADPNVDIAFMREQLAVGTAIASNPVIAAYLAKQATMEAHDILTLEGVAGTPGEVVKSKMAMIQGSYKVYKHLLSLSTPAALAEMTAKIHQATTSN